MTFEIVEERFPEAETMTALLHTPADISIVAKPRSNDIPARAVLSALQFLVWMESRRRPVTPRDVMQRFDISRATSYRWLRTYADARLLAWPPEKAHKLDPMSFPPRERALPAYAGGVH